MIGLVVTGHGHFADGIHTSAQMIAGGVYGKVVGITISRYASPEPAEIRRHSPIFVTFTFLS